MGRRSLEKYTPLGFLAITFFMKKFKIAAFSRDSVIFKVTMII